MAVDISALAAGDGAAFEGLLQLLLSAQNEQRSHAANDDQGAARRAGDGHDATAAVSAPLRRRRRAR